MIRMLLRVLGHEYAQPMRRTVALMTTTAVAEGLSYALLVPVLEALFGSTPGDARPWLIAFGVAVAVYAVLRYVSDLSGMRVGTTLLRGMYHRLGDQLEISVANCAAHVRNWRDSTRYCAPSRCRNLASRSSRKAMTWRSSPSPFSMATAR